MNHRLLSKEVEEYINAHLEDNTVDLIFKPSPFEGVTMQEIVTQLAGKQRIKTKIPHWFAQQGIIYPKQLALEQCSSEVTALYKRALIKGSLIADLTGGLGADSYFISTNTKKMVYIERDSSLCTVAQHNFSVLKAPNIEILNRDAITFLKETNYHFDWIMVDPDRRTVDNKKLILLEECSPNIIQHLPLLLEKSDNILIKTSPMLDINSAITALQKVKEVHILSLHNECKEVLFIVNKTGTTSPKIHAHELLSPEYSFSFYKEEEQNRTIQTGLIPNYIYVPGAAILKAGGFKSIAAQYQLTKLHADSHLYTSSENIKHFPGKKYCIEQVIPFKGKRTTGLPRQANIICRNFSQKPEALYSLLKIKTGGDQFLFFTTDSNNKRIIISCKR